MNIVAIIQARMGSTRLPGKVLKPIQGIPMLRLLIERVRCAKQLNQLVIATSNSEEDKKIVALCLALNTPSFQGNLHDVLDRYYESALHYQADHIVRITADCPLIDPEIIDLVVAHHIQSKADYTSNTIDPTFPDGLDVEVFTKESLIKAWQLAKLASEREHVTPYIWKNPDQFKLEKVKLTPSYAGLRWTVDEPEDFEFVSRIYENLYLQNKQFNFKDVLNFLKRNPKISDINKKFMRNEGLLASLQKDITQ